MTMTEKQQPQVSKRDLKKRKERLETPQQTSQEYYQYRALSAGAVLSLALSAVSLPSVFLATANPFLLILPLIGVCFAGTTVRSLRRRQDEYIGLGYARIALATSALTFGIGTCWAIYTYATEVPEGYQRISFSDLQPVPAHKEIPFSPQAAELSQNKVFVKGYVYPDGQLDNIKQFVLVPDMGTCCFGGQPKLTDMIQVTLEDPLRTKYSYTRRSFAGTFRVEAGASSKVGNVIFHLDADYSK